MFNKIKTLSIFFFCCCVILIIHSCGSKPAVGMDKELLDMANDPTGFTWFKHSDAFLHKSEGSTHPKPWLRTRFNAIASAMLDADGKVIKGTVFPEGSMIVKEMFDDDKVSGLYSILYKNSSNEFADKKGWVWATLNMDGTVRESASNKGNACINCHSEVNNIDFILMNKYFP